MSRSNMQPAAMRHAMFAFVMRHCFHLRRVLQGESHDPCGLIVLYRVLPDLFVSLVTPASWS